MARVLFTTIGSLGDLFPYLAVALELKARGHHAAIATSTLHRSRIEAAGVGWHRLRPEAPDGPPTEIMARAMDPKHGAEVVFGELIGPAVRDQLADLTAVARGYDLLVSTPLSPGTPLVAEQLGLPWAAAALQPFAFLSATDPPVPPQATWLAAFHALGALAGAPVRLLGHATTRRWGAPIRALRTELGLAHRADPLGQDAWSPALNLALFSRALAPHQADWPPYLVQTGFAFFDLPDPAMPTPAGLFAFLDAGPPPVVFTLGSAAVHVARRFYVDSLRAAEAVGRRALLLTGDAPQGLPARLPEWALAVPYAPHAAVFPRACAVVHQGGVGTTAQAMRAGRPMLIVPFAHDQPDNAARVARTGAARTVPIARYTTRSASEGLRRLLADPRAAASAAALGQVIAAEDGVACACDAIERLLTPHSPYPAPAGTSRSPSSAPSPRPRPR